MSKSDSFMAHFQKKYPHEMGDTLGNTPKNTRTQWENMGLPETQETLKRLIFQGFLCRMGLYETDSWGDIPESNR
ncbi:MAG: hypothetical protein LBP99_05625 [Azoarcus sp.]|nr:hypothetical protein [Azoarcus sp.]